jgi:hypothetical protein
MEYGARSVAQQHLLGLRVRLDRLDAELAPDAAL